MYPYARTAGIAAFLVTCPVGTASAQQQPSVQDQLRELEQSSHRFWVDRDREALDSIMAEQFLVVPPNGAWESKAYVLGRGGPAEEGGPRPQRPDRMEVEPDRIELHGNTAIVISRMRGFVGDRALGQGSRVLSVFQRTPDGKWRLIARSITPVLYSSQVNPDEALVRAVIDTYFRGHAQSDSTSMRSAFLPSAHIEGIRNGAFHSWTVDEYVGNFRGRPAADEAARRRTIDVVDITGTAAMVKATLVHGTTTFTDYFVLLKVDGEWKIANKVYHAERRTG